jgi:hypothetical protein
MYPAPATPHRRKAGACQSHVVALAVRLLRAPKCASVAAYSNTSLLDSVQAAGAPAPSQPALTAAAGQPRASSQPQRILEAATAALAPPKPPTPPAGARASPTVRSTTAAPVVQAGACSATGYCFVSANAVDATCPAGTRAAPGTKPLQCYRGCPAGSTLKSDSGTLMCVGGCPTGYSTDGNGQCVEECPDGYTNNGNGQCVQNCPPGMQHKMLGASGWQVVGGGATAASGQHHA